MSGRLLGVEFLVLVALRRVRRGGVTRLGGRFFCRGFPVGGLLGEVLAELVEQGALAQDAPSVEDGLCRVWLTEAGAARFLALGGEYESRGLRVPAPEHGVVGDDEAGRL